MLRTHLIHTCTIQRSTRTRGDNGEEIDTFGAHLSGVKCRLMATNQHAAAAALGLLVASDKTLVVPAGTDVTFRDRIGLVTFEDGTTSGPYNIISVLPRRGAVERFLALSVQKVE